MDATGQITAIEIVEREIEKARESINGSRVPTEWKCGSFFDVAATLLGKREYDVALGNPPFIRFQHFDKQERERAFQLLNSFGYRPNGLANAWIAFVQLSAELLCEGGRLAMVVPAEMDIALSRGRGISPVEGKRGRTNAASLGRPSRC